MCFSEKDKVLCVLVRRTTYCVFLWEGQGIVCFGENDNALCVLVKRTRYCVLFQRCQLGRVEEAVNRSRAEWTARVFDVFRVYGRDLWSHFTDRTIRSYFTGRTLKCWYHWVFRFSCLRMIGGSPALPEKHRLYTPVHFWKALEWCI